ncbi:unnamed protein product [Cochlearia groenlandica]
MVVSKKNSNSFFPNSFLEALFQCRFSLCGGVRFRQRRCGLVSNLLLRVLGSEVTQICFYSLLSGLPTPVQTIDRVVFSLF